MKISDKGNGALKVGIVGCLHGDELIGRDVIELLLQTPMSGVDLKTVIANEEAMLQSVRYVETDLNRSFPGSLHGSKEEVLAYRLREALADREFILDIHSTTADTEDFIIATRSDSDVKKLIAVIPLQRVVYMPLQLAHGAALIDHVCGVSLEFSRKTTPSEVVAMILLTIENFKSQISLPKEEYVGKSILNGNTVLRNFARVAKGTVVEGTGAAEDFYPILSGERAYVGVCCIMCEKLVSSK